MRSMFGIRVSPDADMLSPFRAYVSWLCHLIGLHPILMYYTPSGLTPHSPERALYLNDCHSIGLHPTLMYGTPSGLTIHSPEGALYLNDGYSQSHRERTTITSPERASYTSEAVTALAKWEIYISEAVTPRPIKTRAL
jgi:hypothetical protein